MNKEAAWFRDLDAKLRRDPVYVAETVVVRIAAQVNAALEAGGISRKDLAGKLGVSQPYISQILGGQTNMTILTISKLSCALGMDLSVQIEKRNETAETKITSVEREPLAFSASYEDGKMIERSGSDSGCFSSASQSCVEDAYIA